MGLWAVLGFLLCFGGVVCLLCVCVCLKNLEASGGFGFCCVLCCLGWGGEIVFVWFVVCVGTNLEILKIS